MPTDLVSRRAPHSWRNEWRREDRDGPRLVSVCQSKRMLRGTDPHDPEPQRWSLGFKNGRSRVMPMRRDTDAR